MAIGSTRSDDMPLIRDPRDFDAGSGNLLERAVFNHRALFMLVCALLTAVLAWQATRIEVNASFEKMIPTSHPYILNYRANQGDLSGLGNTVRVVVEAVEGDIYDPAYLETLRRINDELFLLKGTDRTWMRSLWTPLVRWNEVTEEGFSGGAVMPEGFDGSGASIEILRRNVRNAGLVGNLVADDQKSSMIQVPLLERVAETGQALDYGEFASALEQLRGKYQTGTEGAAPVRIHIVGFVKLVGDLIEGLRQVMWYFALAALIATAIIFIYTRCVRSTLLVVACSIVAVVWQVGVIATLGFPIDPYSILVPFLVFAIGVSHGAQKMNGIMQDIGRGTHRYVAARYTFRRLFLAGLTALLADAVGFGVLMIIDVPVIRDLAVAASIGVAVLIFTNLLLLPVLLSYAGVSPAAAERSLRKEQDAAVARSWWNLLDRFTEKGWALGAIAASLVLTAYAGIVAKDLKFGDLDPGAPELRADSRYNRDVAFLTANYGLSTDQFAVIVRTPQDGCAQNDTLIEADRLAQELAQVPGVQTVAALPSLLARFTSATYEANPKWHTISRSQAVTNSAFNQVTGNPSELFNVDCSVAPVIAYLADHKAETLDRVVGATERFAARHNTEDRQFLLAAGNAGVEATTNIVVRESIIKMYLAVYGAVALLCMITFRSLRAVIVALVPLVITSILCKALMVWLGIGLKVATLPVIALGVGIGVDYALYLLSVQVGLQRQGLPLREAYHEAILFTGKVVALVGVTLAAGVVTWVWSPIKFQADMGILLAFMFLWNMLGALVLIPALSRFLLSDPQVASQPASDPLLAAH